MEIELKKLVKSYVSSDKTATVHAVRDVSLKIPSNTVFGIIGKSGAGKSTLVRLISLLEKPDSGAVYYGGERVDGLSGNELIARRRRIGMIFQNFNLFSSRNAAGNVAYPLEICGYPKNKIKSRVLELLDLVGLKDRASAPISTLSGGQKQRVAIARALANDPDILFCDEATSALDPGTTKSILQLIRDIQKKMNLTVVMITHQMEVVRDSCSLVAVVNDGEIVETGSVHEIFTNPRSPVTKDFLSNLGPSDSDSDEPSKDGIVRWSSGGGKYVLHFVDNLTDEPVLSRLSRQFDIEFNIRAGGIQNVQGKKVGQLVADFDGTAEEVEKAVAYLKSSGIGVELADGQQ